ncbi:MAG: hypothetical protein R3242_07925, partial [Akkermansiaceae bacterium]|nr:hypothetical protein [Akkermansiaceae bacterium]
MARRKKRSWIRRLVLALVGSFLLFLLSLFLVSTFLLGPLVKQAIERYGPEALGAEVEVGEVSVDIFRGVTRVESLVVGNPEGYSEPIAIVADHVEIKLDLISLLGDTVVIEDILIEKPVITHEKHKGVANLERLQANALGWADSLASQEDGQESPRRVSVERLRILDGVLRVKLPYLPAVPVKLADIERTHLGGSRPEGQNFGHATKEVLGSLQENAAEVVQQAGSAIEAAG